MASTLRGLPVFIFALVGYTGAQVLVIHLPGKDHPLECEAVGANWNEAVEDLGPGPFAGEIFFNSANAGGCHDFDHETTRGNIVLIDAAAACDDLVQTTSRASDCGAVGVVFFFQADQGLAGIALGDRPVPQLRAIMIERGFGEAIRDGLSVGRVAVELTKGRLIAEDAYEEQFIFRSDEIASTRSKNFLWHVYPEMLPSQSGVPLSTKLMKDGMSIPAGWFTVPPSFIPLFNPSLQALEDGTFLATLRMSNGPGCPSVRRSRESSMDTRIFHNSLVLTHIDSKDFAVLSHVIVETPPFTAHFNSNTKSSGRQFLDEVNGPMDARLSKAVNGEMWVSFYAEMDIPGSNEIARGIHAAPLHISWKTCHSDAALTWQLRHDRGIFSRSACRWLGQGEHISSQRCRESCDAAHPCNAILWREDHCSRWMCLADVATVEMSGWEAWLRNGAPPRWLRGTTTCAWLSSKKGVDLLGCQAGCEASPGCDSVLYSSRHSSCSFQSCAAAEHVSRDIPSGWEAWHFRIPADRKCLGRAWLEPSEVISFPAVSGVEKNWNLIQIDNERLFIEYHIDPHIVLEAGISRDQGIELTSLGTSAASRWPYEVMHGVTNVRGGFCCMPLTPAEFHHLRSAAPWLPHERLFLGVGHLQRIRTPFDQAPGDVGRFRRQAKSRTYHQFFYALRSTAPYDVMAVSTEWCITINGHFSWHWRDVLAVEEEACEAIQFAGGLALRSGDELVVAYGINDCEADLLTVPLARILAMLRPVQSDLNVNLDELEMI